MDAVTEGEADSDGLIKFFVLRDGVCHGPGQLEYALAWRTSGFGHQYGELVLLDARQDIEISQMGAHRFGQAAHDPTDMGRAGFRDEFVPILQATYA